ncbi:hypothetical protein [Luteolibacter sp. LG18]|uniref:hypothetical protein n=1 Tax=Luteolibacter sp. LG18 TaxID=2819286 RepID=UPI0030C6C50A
MVDRIPCKTLGCPNTILPSTAEKTQGLCMPCVHAGLRLERAEYIRQNRRDLNEFDGIEDAVEGLKIIHRTRRHDPLVNWIPHPTPTDKLYADLNEEQQSRLAAYAESLIGSERNQEAKVIVECLAAFTNASLEKCLRAFAAQDETGPTLAYRQASAEIRDHLISKVDGKIEKWEIQKRNAILLSLAWIGDEVVVELFAHWRKHPPAWRDSLYVAPEDYAREAGWELDEAGKRRDLYFHRCNKLLIGPSSDPRQFHAISDSQDSCPWCRRQLVHLFSMIPASFGMENLFDSGVRVQVTTCEVCTDFGVVLGEYDETGSGKWSTSNIRPEYLPTDTDHWGKLPRNPLRVAGSRPPLAAACDFLPTTFSQIGGHPTWIQDAAYPNCPKCSKTMMFLAQVDHPEMGSDAEGRSYAFVCPPCRTTATNYQQT